MSATFIITNCCCGDPTCDGFPCEYCGYDTPASFTVTLAGITISSNELLLGSGTQCWRYTPTSDASGTFCAEQPSDESPCEWSVGVPLAGVENGGETCDFSGVASEIAGMSITRISSTQFTIAVFAASGGADYFVLFSATFDSDVCYLDGVVVNNELESGDVADDESDDYSFAGGAGYTLGYGGTATITACCP